MKNPVPFHRKYPLLILSVTGNQLPGDLEHKLLDFVMHIPMGIYYVYDKVIRMQPAILSKSFWGWFQAQRLLSRVRLWSELAEDALNSWQPCGKIGVYMGIPAITRRNRMV
jgi:hypothetical protein